MKHMLRPVQDCAAHDAYVELIQDAGHTLAVHATCHVWPRVAGGVSGVLAAWVLDQLGQVPHVVLVLD